MKNDMKISKELDFARRINRISLHNKDIEKIKDLLQDELSWSEIFRIVIKNKNIGLLHLCLAQMGQLHMIPSRYRKLLQYYILGNAQRNQELLKEFEIISNVLAEEKICFAPVKGCYLIPNLYKEYGVRSIGDIDILIHRSDGKKISDIMKSLHYIQGRFDSKELKAIPYSREKLTLWNIQMNNMPSFVKESDSSYSQFYKYDFSFNLYPKLKTQPVDLMLDRAEKGPVYHTLRSSDFFIHLCCHLHKEATRTEWIYINGDINFIKFCDVREYLLKMMSESDIQEAIEFAHNQGFEEAIFFTIYYLRELYEDGYEDDILNRLNVKSTDFLSEYKSIGNKESIKWIKSFWERLSSETNIDELDNRKEKVSFEKYLDI